MHRFIWTLAGLGCTPSERFEPRETTPSADSTDVLADTAVRLTYRRAVDASEAEVHWSTFGENHRIPAAIEVVADDELRIVPLETPRRGVTQEVRVVGLRSGNQEGVSEVRFRTRSNPRITVVRDGEEILRCTVDAQHRWERCIRDPHIEYYTYDAARLVGVETFEPQPDGTEARVASSTYTYGPRETVVQIDTEGPAPARFARELDDRGFIISEWTQAPGADAAFDNEDDVYADVTFRRPDPSGFDRVVRYGADPGDDATWWTDDDRYSRYEHTQVDALGRPVERRMGFIGPDNLELTSDDDLYWVERFFYDAEGRLAGGFVYDPRIRREEDAFGRRATLEDGRIVQIAYFEGTGPDGAWLTEDDPTPFQYDAFTYDADGQRLVERLGVEAGPDEALFTDDDVAREVIGYAP
ncbi:MAG: hypothetical protein AAGA48_16170 [Myxococcota bacterium]